VPLGTPAMDLESYIYTKKHSLFLSGVANTRLIFDDHLTFVLTFFLSRVC